jgi:AcrR family transcriptional regulator
VVATRDRLLDAAAAALAEDGVSGVSARTVAARAEINQALVFYHFGTVDDLLDAAVRRTVDVAISTYHDRFADVTSLAGLLTLGRELHRTEQERGNVAQMAQVMAGARRSPTLAAAGRYAMDRWSAEVESAVVRVLPGTPLAGIVDPRGLAQAVAAGFIGLALYDGVDPDAATGALGSLDAIGALVAAFDGLPPVAVRAVRTRARRAVARADAVRGGAR